MVQDDPHHHRRLERAAVRLQRRLPGPLARTLRRLLAPGAKWIRLPAGGLLVAGGVFSFLPVLGLWMLPLGIVLLAYDIPALKPPVGRLLVSAELFLRRRRRRL